MLVRILDLMFIQLNNFFLLGEILLYLPRAGSRLFDKGIGVEPSETYDPSKQPHSLKQNLIWK